MVIENRVDTIFLKPVHYDADARANNTNKPWLMLTRRF